MEQELMDYWEAALGERRAIVAYLREKSSIWSGVTRQVVSAFANEIERGDHHV